MQENELNSRLESLKESLQQNKRPSPVLEMATEESFNESLTLLVDHYIQELLINVSENAIDSEGKMVFIGSERIMDEVIFVKLGFCSPQANQILNQSRLHEADMPGVVICDNAEGEWQKLVLPLDYEMKRKEPE